MLKSIFQPLLTWYLATLKTAGYPVIVLLMTMESSVLPIPAEAIIPPAAYLAWSEGLKIFNVHFVGWPAEIGLVAAGVLGSWLGATIMYWLSRLAGRPLLVRYGRYILMPPEKIEKSERWMSHYGPMGVFVARLLPGARQLVGIPAGVARMDYLKYSDLHHARRGDLVLGALLCRRQGGPGRTSSCTARCATWPCGSAAQRSSSADFITSSSTGTWLGSQKAEVRRQNNTPCLRTDSISPVKAVRDICNLRRCWP